jgi:shikimate dehydrogenase
MIPLCINKDLCYYDLIYNPQKPRMVREMEHLGIRASGGLGMLVNQAAISFEIWTGKAPDRGKMLQAALECLREETG